MALRFCTAPSLSLQGAPAPASGYWMAITCIAGKGSVSKAFSVAEHGHDKARALAVEERQRQLEQKSREDIAA